MSESAFDYRHDPIVEAVREKIRLQSLKGQMKYGTTMERTDLELISWLRHLQEELIDGTVYLERIMRDLRENNIG